MTAEYCFWHHRYEELDDPFRVCFECGHVFNKEEDLIAAWNAEKPSGVAEVQDSNLVYNCPYCIHDW